MPGNKIIWIIDDNDTLRIAGEIEVLKKAGAGYDVVHHQSIAVAVEALRQDATLKIPKIIFFDALQGEEGKENGKAGYRNFLYMIQKLKESGISGLPEYVVFLSADERYADTCKELAEELDVMPSGNIVAIYRDAIEQVDYLLRKRPELRLRADYSDWSLNAFFNRMFGTDLPADEDAFDRYRVQHGILDAGQAIQYWQDGKISADQTLDLINKDNDCGDGTYVEYSANYKHVFFTNFKSLQEAKEIVFDKASGEDCHGYAAFTFEQVQELKRQGKAPVLILERFDFKLYEHISGLGGLVIVKAGNTGHIFLLAKGSKVPALIGAVDDIVLDQGVMGEKAGMLSEEGVIISYGDPVTMGCYKANLYKEHLYLRSDQNRDYVGDIPGIYCEAMTERGLPVMKFKANIDSLSQLDEAAGFRDGIGLVRAEHLAFADPKQLRALRRIFTGSGHDKKALNVFAERQRTQAAAIFERADWYNNHKKPENSYPVRIRLLDAPPEEFLTAQEVEQLSASIEPEDQRGVQMGLKKPELYRAQLEAVFRAYGDYLTTVKERENPAIVKLEIMIPMVKTLDEILAVDEMAAGTAEKFSIPQDRYRFGITLETMEAAKSVALLAPHIDFISYGTNDLTSAALNLSRSDHMDRERYCRLGLGDPFVRLHPGLINLIIYTAQKARAANPSIEIELCGAHAEDLASLKALFSVGLDGVSVPPSDRNRYALRADYELFAWRQYKKECSPA
ncbi:MAG: hypothetical protein PHY92_05670 [Alphaproteobacteria bacterium]|nr:hypothetical protein [Alphaproteobacteria bacterium]